MICPACQTPLVEPIHYANDGILVRGGTLKITTLDNGRKVALWTCRRCGQVLDMGEEWAAAAEVLYRREAVPKVVAGVSLRIRSYTPGLSPSGDQVI